MRASLHSGSPAPAGALVATLVVFATVGCTDDVIPPPTIADQQLAEGPTHPGFDRVLPPGTTDREFLDVNRTVPGFGGLFLDETGLPVVYLTDPGRSGEARDAVRSLLQRRDRSTAGFRVEMGEYAWSELIEWRHRLRDVFSIEGVRFLGVDESRNRVHVGVGGNDVADAVRQLLVDEEVPEEAVIVEVVGRVALLGALAAHARVPSDGSEASTFAVDTLGSKVRPVLGGLRINRHFAETTCTFGFNIDGLEPGFVTASHCLPPFGDTLGGSNAFKVHQPDSLDTDGIGFEWIDPPTFESGDPEDAYSWCGTLQQCRYSDVVVARYYDPGPGNDPPWAFGEIAKTTRRGFTSEEGSDTIDGSFLIQDRMDSPLWGTWIDKVGATTGWTHGQVQKTCYAVTQSQWEILCASAFNGLAGPGDSGSPVFEQVGHNLAVLAGVLWGRNEDDTWFSPMSMLDEDFGGHFDFDMASDTAPPPPQVTIEGPDLIEPDATCTWSADVTVGDPPYSYTWWNHLTQVSTDSTYTGGKLSGHSGNSFKLTVEVEDDTGQTATDELVVTEDALADPCLI